jgi:Heterokaryon incompatibility protein (HET)
MSVEYFHYMPLEEGHIRLLALRQCRNQDDPIECELYSYELDSTPPYEALSYVWGDPHTTRVILLQGSTFRVTGNLYYALRRLRQSRRQSRTNRILWVDAICINQNDVYEKNTQVARMGDIYAKAESVVVYLGEATEATDQSMDYLMQIEERGISQIPSTIKLSEVTGREDDLRLEEGFRDILSRPWFQRVWIVQDVFNARAAVVHCGSKAVSSKTFARASQLWLDKPDGLSQQVLNLMPGSRRDDRVASKYQLYDLLQRFQHAKATDPRDKIYALLGMVDDGNSKITILQDYSMSQKDLMRAVIANLCFCEWSSVPEPPYDTIDEFLSNLDPIDNDILKKIFESSQEIDLESLLRHGSHYIRIDRFLVEAASRNKTKGDEMVKLLHKAIDQERSASPTPSEATSLFSDVSAPSTNTSYPPEDVEISVWHVVEILLTQDSFADLCRRGFHRKDLEPARFANNLRRMLKNFGRTLLSEGQSYSARLTAQLILGGSRRMAALIRVRHDPSYERVGSKLIDSNLDSMTETERRSRIDKFIQQLNSADTEGAKQSLDTIENNSDLEDDPDTVLHEEAVGVSSLDEIENFILSNQAFEGLLETLTSFLKLSKFQDVSPSVAVLTHVQPQSMAQVPLQIDSNEPLSMLQEYSRERSSTTLPDLELPKDSFWMRVYERLSHWLTRIERPKAGLHRIQYTCVRSSRNLYGKNMSLTWVAELW